MGFILLRNPSDLILRFWIIKRELEKISDEATTDCYNEYEQIAGWCDYLMNEINLPCKCKINQNDGLLIGFETNKDGSALLAVVKVDMNEYKIAAETGSILIRKI
ncbi:MAG TPA: calcium-binding protein [Candidatus Nitrosocosmicus sp.]